MWRSGHCASVTAQAGLDDFSPLPDLQLVALGASEKADAHRTHARLKHLQQLGAPQQERMLAWQRQRLDIMLVDHFLRSGLYDTAAELAKDSRVEVGPASPIFVLPDAQHTRILPAWRHGVH